METTLLTQVTEATFAQEVEQADRLTLVDFVTAWCPHCRTMAPLVERIADEYADRLKVTVVDVDANPGLAGRFGIKGLPTIIFYHNGEAVHRLVGAVGREVLQATLATLLAPAGAAT